MQCPLCRTRKARRPCPALGQTICAVCCGTKRLTEIACPADCVYLSSARQHPAAVVRRQQEHDLAVLVPTLAGLTERQYQLFFLFQTVIARHQPEGFSRLMDGDLAEAAGAVAATLETAARGIIYDHAAQSLPARRLSTELTQLLADIRQQGGSVPDREAALVLRAIERGARETGAATDGSDTAYLALMARLLQQGSRQRDAKEAESHGAQTAQGGSSLILP